MRINKVLLFLNEYRDPPLLFQNLSSYKINGNQKFDKNLSVGYISEKLICMTDSYRVLTICTILSNVEN